MSDVQVYSHDTDGIIKDVYVNLEYAGTCSTDPDSFEIYAYSKAIQASSSTLTTSRAHRKFPTVEEAIAWLVGVFKHALKTCCTCGVSLPVSTFWKDRSRDDGYTIQCKHCRKDYYNKVYYPENRRLVIQRILGNRKGKRK